ncbi:hypothetical protein [Streptomyces paludis]|uniref:Uncharacterized protein n=1 Tax=Streptomyces paludis TaxID=2282738 RepID=A0A345HR66_9ACTN|nr:hypothetical protein [Streptomyces paludis]AXG79190.1 hypothetical protein DVK44_17695 [Streptomyces paludis]
MTQVNQDNQDNQDSEGNESSRGGGVGGRGGAGQDPGEGFARALERLDAGAEPPMPDLVRASIAQGYRIRTRRRVSTALGSAVGVLVLAGGAMTLPSMLSGLRVDRPSGGVTTATVPGPRTMPGILYPSASALHTAYPNSSLKLTEASPRDAVVPGRYFRLTGAGVPDGSLLYVAAFPTVTEARDARQALAAGECVSLAGQYVTTPWKDHAWCTEPTVLRKNKAELQAFTPTNGPSTPTPVDLGAAQPLADATTGRPAVGVTYVTEDGWTVQVVAGALDGATAASTAGRAPAPNAVTSSGVPPLPVATAAPDENDGLSGPAPVATGDVVSLRTLVMDLATSDRLLELLLESTD